MQQTAAATRRCSRRRRQTRRHSRHGADAMMQQTTAGGSDDGLYFHKYSTTVIVSRPSVSIQEQLRLVVVGRNRLENTVQSQRPQPHLAVLGPNRNRNSSCFQLWSGWVANRVQSAAYQKDRAHQITFINWGSEWLIQQTQCGYLEHGWWPADFGEKTWIRTHPPPKGTQSFTYTNTLTRPPDGGNHPLWQAATEREKDDRGRQTGRPLYTWQTTSTALQLAVDHAFSGTYVIRFRPGNPEEASACPCGALFKMDMHILYDCPHNLIPAARHLSRMTTSDDGVDSSHLRSYCKPNFWVQSHNPYTFDGTGGHVSMNEPESKTEKTRKGKNKTRTHPDCLTPRNSTLHHIYSCIDLVVASSGNAPLGLSSPGRCDRGAKVGMASGTSFTAVDSGGWVIRSEGCVLGCVLDSRACACACADDSWGVVVDLRADMDDSMGILSAICGAGVGDRGGDTHAFGYQVGDDGGAIK
ncbi:hypothetical protein EDB89DRAFT_1911709 [Lactarius sanguifluus]|nr:hypothetical protein EDB89DRAFT_1911709 [Lactarius sanguifluus]